MRLTNLRHNKELTQKELADAIHVSRDSIAKWESDSRRSIPTEIVIRLADFFDVTCDYILRGISSENVQIWRDIGLSEISIKKLSSLKKKKPVELDERKIKLDFTPSVRFVNQIIESMDILDTSIWYENYETLKNRNHENGYTFYKSRMLKGNNYIMNNNDAMMFYAILLSDHIKSILLGREDVNSLFSQINESSKTLNMNIKKIDKLERAIKRREEKEAASEEVSQHVKKTQE